MVQEPADAGAVNRPVLEIALQESVQATGADAVNCCVSSACRLADAGVSVMGDVTVTVAEAGLPRAGVAVTVQVPGASGAVYKPEDVTEPQEADHVSPAAAVNC